MNDKDDRAPGLTTRSEPLRIALKALDEALATNPDNPVLRQRRAVLAQELAALPARKDLPELQARLAEIEEQMATPGNHKGAAQLVETHQRLLRDIEELVRFGETPKGPAP